MRDEEEIQISARMASVFPPSGFIPADPETLKTLQNIRDQYLNRYVKLVYKLPAKDDWPTKDCFYLQEEHILYLLFPALEYLWRSAFRLVSQRRITGR